MTNHRLFIIQGKNKIYEEYYRLPIIAETAIQAECIARGFGCDYVLKTNAFGKI